MLRMNVIDNVFCFLKNNSNKSVSNLSKTNVNVEENDSSLIETDDSANLKRSRVTKSKYERKKIYSGKYKCSDCDYKCDIGRNIKIHKEVVHLNIKKFYCNYCTQKTYWKLNMIKHMKSIHPNQKEIINEIEKKANSNKEKLKNKTLKNGKKKQPHDKLLKCLTCNFSTDHSKSLRLHTERVHQQLMRYQCGMCDFRTFNRIRMKKHHEAKHKNINQDTPYFSLICTLCFEEVDHKEHSYIDPKMTKILKYKCNICDFKTSYKYKIGHHQKKSHSDEKDLKTMNIKEIRVSVKRTEKAKCFEKDCDYSTNSNSNLTRHKQHVHKIRVNEKKKKTEVKRCVELDCDFSTNRKRDLKSHNQRVHKMPPRNKLHRYACNLCQYTAFNHQGVRLHQKKQHMNENVQVLGIGCKLCEKNISHIKHKQKIPYQKRKISLIDKVQKVDKCDCSVCGKGFNSFRKRIRHYQKEHPKDKIFNCKDCKYGTNFLPNLNTHRSSKHENKDMNCPQCSFTTTWNPTFLRHMRNEHGHFQRKSKSSVANNGQANLCEDCGFSSYNIEKLKLHKQKGCAGASILPVRVDMFKCNKCPYKSEVASNILEHVRNNHSGGT